MSVNTAYPFSGGLKAIQGHSSVTATTALLQESSSAVAVTPTSGALGWKWHQEGFTNSTSKTELIFQPLPIPEKKKFKSYWQKMFFALFV